MAKTKTKTHSDMPEGMVPLRAARAAGFFMKEVGNTCQGMLIDVVETDDPFKKGARRFFFKIQITEGGADKTLIRDAETEENRKAGEGEVIAVDEVGYLKVLRECKGREIWFKCTGQEDEKAAKKKGRNPAWLFEVAGVPF